MHTGFTDLNPEVKPVGPSPYRQALNLARSLPGAVQSGFQIVPDDVYETRLATCKTCYFWDDKGNAGFGKCNHPKCGCTKAKLRLSVSECPIQNWGKYAK